jgi:hypothetical protein
VVIAQIVSESDADSVDMDIVVISF